MTFRTKHGLLPLPIFFPDATRAFVKAASAQDVTQTHTPGVLVNTYHLYKKLTDKTLAQFDDLRDFMSWPGAVISDSGGFQIMSLAKKEAGKGITNKAVTDKGVKFVDYQLDGSKQEILFTPEISIRSQLRLKTDLLVVLDDFTPRDATYEQAQESVRRTIVWAKRSKAEFKKLGPIKNRPYLIGVVQGGRYQDLRKKCAQELIKIGFDGLGFGGWPIQDNGEFDYDSARTIAEQAPDGYLLYGLGIGKPEDIVGCVKLGFNIFDCVLPTRDARHGRLYVFSTEDDKKIDLNQPDFYHYLNPEKQKHATDNSPVSPSCDCLLCQNYSRAYLRHLFKNKDATALRLATIHNLRFYARLMEKLKKE